MADRRARRWPPRARSSIAGVRHHVLGRGRGGPHRAQVTVRERESRFRRNLPRRRRADSGGEHGPTAVLTPEQRDGLLTMAERIHPRQGQALLTYQGLGSGSGSARADPKRTVLTEAYGTSRSGDCTATTARNTSTANGAH